MWLPEWLQREAPLNSSAATIFHHSAKEANRAVHLHPNLHWLQLDSQKNSYTKELYKSAMTLSGAWRRRERLPSSPNTPLQALQTPLFVIQWVCGSVGVQGAKTLHEPMNITCANIQKQFCSQNSFCGSARVQHLFLHPSQA